MISTTTGTLPNALIIGAMRSGTTALSRYLGAHPDVFMAPQKEIYYFDGDAYRRGVEWYQDQFAGADGHAVVAEATPTYMCNGFALERMAQLVPDAKLIAILRNPVDRAYSHYWLRRSTGKETLDFKGALAAESERSQSSDHREREFFRYVERGRYVGQLEEVAGHYPRSAVHVVIFEHMRAKARETYAELCRFLEIDDTVMPELVGAPINAHNRYRSVKVRTATKNLPRPVRRVVGKLNAKPSDYPEMDGDVRAGLLDTFRNDNASLAAWLGRDLTIWDR